MKPTLVLFDVDGTLVDTAGAGRRAIERAFAEVFGVDEVASFSAGVRFAGMTDLRIFQSLADAAGIERRHQRLHRDRLHEAYYAALGAEMARRDPRARVLPGVGPLLRALSGMPRVHLGLLTGNLERGARIKLEPFGLNPYFAGGGFGSDDPDRRKIARLARETLSRRFGIVFDPDRVVVVGDTEHDVDCARANRYRAVAVVSGWASRDVLEAALPDALLDDLTDGARALAALGLVGPAPERRRPAQLS